MTSSDTRIVQAIESSDTDELLRIVDGMVASRDWEGLVSLRRRCQEAVTRGRQLWGVDEHIRYRLALQAPGRWAGPAVTEGPARFALGPLAEVAASTKTWEELAPHLSPGPERLTTAAERVVRGESGTGPIVDLPDHLQPWEPEYRTPTYHSDRVEDQSPPPPAVEPVDLPKEVGTVSDPDSEDALAHLVSAWTDESNGRCQTVTVEGGIVDAIRGLGLSAARLARIPAGDALAWMAWAGASAGAHGRRRGAAAGRYGAWWVVATLCDLDWPPDPDAMGEAVRRLEWAWFDDGAPGTGWQLRLAVADPDTGLAWAVSAIDWSDDSP
ncbi:MAG TPA: hypothetical protein VF246_00690 [Acidimicrobiia bacterium]